jgi:hypothetical protein
MTAPRPHVGRLPRLPPYLHVGELGRASGRLWETYGPAVTAWHLKRWPDKRRWLLGARCKWIYPDGYSTHGDSAGGRPCVRAPAAGPTSPQASQASQRSPERLRCGCL